MIWISLNHKNRIEISFLITIFIDHNNEHGKQPSIMNQAVSTIAGSIW